MKILVPVDGSDFSMGAVKVALKFAKATKTDIHLMTVTPLYQDSTSRSPRVRFID